MKITYKRNEYLVHWTHFGTSDALSIDRIYCLKTGRELRLIPSRLASAALVRIRFYIKSTTPRISARL